MRRAIGAAGGNAQMRMHRTAQPGPRLSGCFYNGAGAHVSFRIDTAQNSRQRFSNRNVEAIQFSFDTPERRPRNVPGVGDRGLRADFDPDLARGGAQGARLPRPR